MRDIPRETYIYQSAKMFANIQRVKASIFEALGFHKTAARLRNDATKVDANAEAWADRENDLMRCEPCRNSPTFCHRHAEAL